MERRSVIRALLALPMVAAVPALAMSKGPFGPTGPVGIAGPLGPTGPVGLPGPTNEELIKLLIDNDKLIIVNGRLWPEPRDNRMVVWRNKGSKANGEWALWEYHDKSFYKQGVRTSELPEDGAMLLFSRILA